MIKVNRRISLAADPETVWPYIADPTRFAEWRRGAGVTSAAPIGDGPMAVGSRFRMDVTTQGQSGSLECTVTALEEHRRFAFESIDKSGFSGSADTRLEPDGTGTQLDFAFELSMPGKWRLMQPVISRVVNQAADADFATLQAKFAP
ncbi:MAG TPA: SRPBCC family protein [Pleomorphomonadaceae bacterium]|nr:SRPBCC family protein [Pleomorphomonadaceae bacterium]